MRHPSATRFIPAWLALLLLPRLAAGQAAPAPGWEPKGFLKAFNADPKDYGGAVIAISGDTMVVGCGNESSNAPGLGGDPADNSLPKSGAAYVWVRVQGTWTRQAFLKASNPEAEDLFGFSAAISGDTIVIGAVQKKVVENLPLREEGNRFAGAAYVFVRSGDTWTQQAYLRAAQPKYNAQFGYSVAIEGDTIVVSSPGEAGPGAGIELSGAVHVYSRLGTQWSEATYLRASNPDVEDFFGESVAISGNTIVVGASYQGRSAAVEDAGAAYVFTKTGAAWVQQAYLKASNARDHYYFGVSVGISGDTIAVGSMEESSGAQYSGAVYVFSRTGGTWTQAAMLKSSPAVARAELGYSVAIEGDRIVAGANAESADGAQYSGAAYVFARVGGTWTQESRLRAPFPEFSDRFGSGVAFGAGTIAVGANQDDSGTGNPADGGLEDSGAVYVFRSNQPPPPPTLLAQVDPKGRAVGTGGTAHAGFTIRGIGTDLFGSAVQLQIEAKPAGAAFDGSDLLQGASARSGTFVSATLASFQLGGFHWRARVSNWDHESAWVDSGNPVDITLVDEAPTLRSVRLARAGEAASLEIGASLSDDESLRFEVEGVDGDDDPLFVEIEVVDVQGPFTGAATLRSALTESGRTAGVELSPAAGDYRWQARVVDQYGGASAWSRSGSEGPDFRVYFRGSDNATCLGSAGGVGTMLSFLAIAGLLALAARAI